jgi:hypothetical protein
LTEVAAHDRCKAAPPPIRSFLVITLPSTFSAAC